MQKRLQRRHGGGASHTSRVGASQRYSDPAFNVSARSGRSARGRYTSRSAMSTSRSMMSTVRSSSPTGRYHPDPTRRLELRKVRAPHGAMPSASPSSLLSPRVPPLQRYLRTQHAHSTLPSPTCARPAPPCAPPCRRRRATLLSRKRGRPRRGDAEWRASLALATSRPAVSPSPPWPPPPCPAAIAHTHVVACRTSCARASHASLALTYVFARPPRACRRI